jgi:hypothetical protein
MPAKATKMIRASRLVPIPVRLKFILFLAELNYPRVWNLAKQCLKIDRKKKFPFVATEMENLGRRIAEVPSLVRTPMERDARFQGQGPSNFSAWYMQSGIKAVQYGTPCTD